jgi:hypothetical protein
MPETKLRNRADQIQDPITSSNCLSVHDLRSPSFDETIFVNFPRLGIEPGTFIFPISSAEPKQLPSF